jgi:hypothetical protein
MGRPINKRNFGNGDGGIKISRHYFTGGSLTLVNKATNGDIAEGEMEIDAILDDSTTVHVTRLYGRKIQYEGGTEDVAKVRWAAGEHPGADDSGANVDSF